MPKASSRRHVQIGAAACLLSLLACSDSANTRVVPELRDCPPVIWARSAGSGTELRVVGSWDGFQEPGVLLFAEKDGWFAKRLDLQEGEYGYLVRESGKERLDPYNGLTTFAGNKEVSLLVVGQCEIPELRIDAVDVGPPEQASASASIRGTFLRGAARTPLRAASFAVSREIPGSREGGPADARIASIDPTTGEFRIEVRALARGNNVFRVAATDESGRRADKLVSAWVEPLAATWNDALVYQIFVDRFRGANGAVLKPPATPGMRAGGTLDGVRAEIEKGTFDALGVTALWLSPLATTPDESRIGVSGRLEQAYHGYWQLDSRQVDPRLGGEAALDQLVSVAHQRGMRVLVDIVPNHVYEKNPRYLLHHGTDWFHEEDAKCICGSENCSWQTDIEHCWFTDYLPDYRFENVDVMRQASDDAAYWMTRFHVDGVRIDAVPMMPRAATRRILDGLRRAIAPRSSSFALGEVYTGTEGLEMIRYYLGPDGLDSAFDFPLMWTIRDVIAADRAGFDAIDAQLDATDAGLVDSNSVMARMLDNHDTTRFLSEAAGDGGKNPWDDPPHLPSSDTAYQKLALGLGLLLTLPGVPIIYYGDEVALPGASDPDNRRVMPREEDLDARQRATLDLTRRLGTLRAELPSLRIGSRRTLVADRDTYAFVRQAPNAAPVVVLLSKRTEASTILLGTGSLATGTYVDAWTREPFVLTAPGAVTVPMDALSFRILVGDANTKSH